MEARWISEGRFLHALNYCMLLPGPEAQQLATYLGWLMHRTWGGLAAGLLFVLPSLLILIVLSAIYVRYGNAPQMQAVLYGIKPAVIVLVLGAAWRLGKTTLKSSTLISIAVIALAAILAHVSFVLIIVVAAILGLLAQRLRLAGFTEFTSTHAASTGAQSLAPAIINDATPAPAHAKASVMRSALICVGGAALAYAAWLILKNSADPTLANMAAFFSRAALLTFGGAYAVLPYVTQASVEQYQWLTAAQMMDGLALGETTPGPLIMIVAFVGYLGAAKQAVLADALYSGILGACVATFFTFLPSFIFIFAGAPWIEHTRNKLGFVAPLRAISAAVVGVIVSLAFYFGHHVFWVNNQVDIAAIIIAAIACYLQFMRKTSVMWLILICACLGLGASYFRVLGLAL